MKRFFDNFIYWIQAIFKICFLLHFTNILFESRIQFRLFLIWFVTLGNYFLKHYSQWLDLTLWKVKLLFHGQVLNKLIPDFLLLLFNDSESHVTDHVPILFIFGREIVLKLLEYLLRLCFYLLASFGKVPPISIVDSLLKYFVYVILPVPEKLNQLTMVHNYWFNFVHSFLDLSLFSIVCVWDYVFDLSQR